ncbi:MAG: XrtA/PEP-CTERM system amidotransferase [Pseudomonadota bacterium]
MCGITGLFDLKERRDVDRSLIARMNRAQVHRGPDEEGTYFEPGVGLGHQRLSIIDIKSGQQPLFNEDGSVAVVYNGEIYNFQTLMAELTELGYQFRTRCDTEVVVHAWEEWGEDCVTRFRGMFAFAIWDANKQCIFLARDRLGVKPLFYSELKSGWLAFGSELKALAAHPDFDREIDPLAVEEYFALGYAAEPRTVYRRTLKLPPASHLTIRKGQPLPEPKQYWDVRFTVDNPMTLESATDELRERLTESVKLRMIADVPLGAFLSGGVDSSAVVALMSSLSSSPVNTCSIAFDDPNFNESEFAQLVADRYATNHYSKTVAADDFGLVDKLAGFYDEPYADSSAIPTYRVCELARQRVKVALSGDGADEIFGGYRRYRLHLMEEGLRSKLPLGLRRPVFGLLGKLYPKADWAPRFLRAKTTFEGLARDSVQGYLHSVSILSDAMRAQLYSPRMKAELAGYSALDVFRRHATQADTDDSLALIQYIDIKTYLVGDINTKVDRASMAHSLEVREPLMDHELIEWVASLPSRLKHRRGEGKYVLKKTLEPLLPNDVLYRPKMGFAVPLASWFRGPLAERVKESLLGERLHDTGLFNRDYLEHLVTAHQSGRRDYSASIWTVLMYEAFLRGQESSLGLAESG